jgi:hypothetical protein
LCSQEFTSATDPSQTDGPSCIDGFRDSNSDLMTAGGTSASSPSFAGMLTLLVEKYGKHRHRDSDRIGHGDKPGGDKRDRDRSVRF